MIHSHLLREVAGFVGSSFSLTKLSLFISLLFFLFSFIVLPVPAVSAAVDTAKCDTPRGEGAQTEIGCIPKDPAGFAAQYYTYGLGMIGGLSLIFIIIGGYLMLTSQGNPIQLRNGKTYIFYALFGLLLAIFGYVFIEVILIDILRVPGFER